MRILRAIRYLAVLPLLLLTLAFSPRAGEAEGLLLTGQDVFVLDQALVMGQGLTTDGEYYYTSGAITALDLTALAKFTFNGFEPVAQKLNPLPEVCRARGNDHIGGISCYDGKIYASVEGGDECYACVAVFRCEDLSFTGEVYDLPNELYPDGVPWLAVDPETGLLYASVWSHAKTVNVYDVNDGMRFVRSIPVTGLGELDRIQGGEFYHGMLYLSQDSRDNGTRKRLLRLDPGTDAVTVAAERDVNGSHIEAEGMTFLVRSEAPSLFVLDYNKAVGVFLREYAVASIR